MSTTFSASSPGLGNQDKLNENVRDTMKHTTVDSGPTSNKKLKPNIQAQRSRLLSSVGKNYNIRHGLPRSLHAIIDRYDVDVDDVDVDDVDVDDVDVDYPIRRETFILIPTYIWIES